jgi:hypothetical protein
MFLTNISPLSHIISNSTCVHVHATKFGWMLDNSAVNVVAEFYGHILTRQGFTIQQGEL